MTSRRDVVKAGLGLAGIVLSGKAPAVIVRSLVGAKESNAIDASSKNPYITDGLIGMWDGEWNAGLGHHSGTANIWKDLVGSNDMTVTSAGTWTPNSLVCNGTRWGSYVKYSAINDVITYEAVFSILDTSKYGYYVQVARTTSLLGFMTDVNKKLIVKGGIGGTAWSMPPIGDLATYTYVHSNTGYKNGTKTTISGYTNWSQNAGYISIGGRRNESHGSTCTECCCLRVYNRALTGEEVAHNYAVDKERFGL